MTEEMERARKKILRALGEYVGFPPDYVPEWIDWHLAISEILSIPEIRIEAKDQSLPKLIDRYKGQVKRVLIQDNWKRVLRK